MLVVGVVALADVKVVLAATGTTLAVDCAKAVKAFCAVELTVETAWLAAASGLIWIGDRLLVLVTMMNSCGAAGSRVGSAAGAIVAHRG